VGRAVHGTSCPRCTNVVGITRKDRLYQHQTPYGTWCPYSGVTLQDAQNKITSLARRLLNAGLVKDDTGAWIRPEEALDG